MGTSVGVIIDKPQDLLIIRKFVRRKKGSNGKIVNSQIFEKAANLGALTVREGQRFSVLSKICPQNEMQLNVH